VVPRCTQPVVLLKDDFRILGHTPSGLPLSPRDRDHVISGRIAAHKHQFVGSGAAAFVTSYTQVLAKPTAKGILGTIDRRQYDSYSPIESIESVVSVSRLAVI
jgi:hypothetical protein